MSDQRQSWFARVVESGLQNQIFHPAVFPAPAPPAVFGPPPPPMTPERVLETVTPELLARHLPHEVLWSCIAAAAARAGVTNVVVS